MSGALTTDHINETMNSQVAEPKAVAKENDIRKVFETTETLRYFKNDTYTASPKALLGAVFYQTGNSTTLTKFPTAVDGAVDESSILKAPQTRSELILNASATASADVLSYLSASLSADELYELRVIDNTAGRLIDRGDKWDAALLKWMSNVLAKKIIDDPKVGAIGVVTGMVQKYVTIKKYKKFEVGAKGGGFGVNVNGTLYTSSSEFSLDIIYGLDLVYLPKTTSVNEFLANIEGHKVIRDRAELGRLSSYFAAMSSADRLFADS